MSRFNIIKNCIKIESRCKMLTEADIESFEKFELYDMDARKLVLKLKNGKRAVNFVAYKYKSLNKNPYIDEKMIMIRDRDKECRDIQDAMLIMGKTAQYLRG